MKNLYCDICHKGINSDKLDESDNSYPTLLIDCFNSFSFKIKVSLIHDDKNQKNTHHVCPSCISKQLIRVLSKIK